MTSWGKIVCDTNMSRTCTGSYSSPAEIINTIQTCFQESKVHSELCLRISRMWVTFRILNLYVPRIMYIWSHKLLVGIVDFIDGKGHYNYVNISWWKYYRMRKAMCVEF